MMKKITFILTLFLTGFLANYTFAQHSFTTVVGPTVVAQGSPVTLNINDAGNTLDTAPASSTGSYSTFSVSVDWTDNSGGPWSSEADLTMTTTAGSVIIDPATTGGANDAVATTLTFDGTFTAPYDPTTDGFLDIVLNQSYTGSSANWSNIVVTIYESPTCIDPDTFAVNNITTTSADLSWNDPSGVQFDFEYVIQAQGTGMPAGSGTPVSAMMVTDNTLTANTPYEAWVRAYCGGTDYSAWVGPINFTTLCNAFTAPFLESFETNTFPACWAQGGATTWEYGSSATTPTGFAAYGAANVPDHSVSGAGTFIGMDGSDNTDGEVSTLTTPLVDISGLTTPYLSYYVFSNNTNDAAQNELMVEFYDGSVWTTVETIQANLGTNWVLYGVDLTTFTITGDVQARFTVTGVANGGSTFYNDILIDDVSFDEAPTCYAPTGLAVSNITNNSADLTWTDGSGGTQFDFYYVIQPQGTGTAGITVENYYDYSNGVPFTATCTDISNCGTTLLTSNTAYEVYVRDDCGGAWVGPVNFTTLCDAFTAPFLESFETNTFPACWFQGGATTWEYGSSATTPTGFAAYGAANVPDHSVSGAGTFIGMDGSDNTDGEVSTLTTPMIDISGLTTPYLSYYVFSNNTNDAAQNELMVEFFDGSAWTTVETIQANLGVDWVMYGVDLTTFTITGDVQARFTVTGVSNGGSTFYNDILIDDVSIDEAPTCFAPTGLAVSNVTTNTADLTWSDGSGGAQFDFYYVIQPQGTGTAGITVENYYDYSSGVPFTATCTDISDCANTLLTPNTAYEVYVRDDCGGAWVGPVNFSTSCNPYTIPYFEGFESGYVDQAAVDGCLTQESITGTQVWTANNTLTTYNRTPRTGAWNAYLRYSNDDWLFIPIDLTGGTSYTVELYARQDGATATNSDITISYGTTGDAAGMINAIVPATGIVNGNYQQITGSFTPASTGTYYVGIKGYMNGSPWYISLDDISIDVTPACPAPSGVVASNVTSTTADLSWNVTTGNYEYVLDMNAADPTGAGTPIAGEAYNATVLTPETTYYFHVRSDCGSAWTTISFTTSPANDDCANAEVLTPGAVFTDNPVVGTNVGATDSGETLPTCASYSGGDVWYSVQVPASGTITIETNSNSDGITDTGLAVYSGTCGSLTLIECDDDDSADGLFSMVALTSGITPGEVLYVNVWEYGNDVTGTFQVSAYDASLSSNTFNSNEFVAYPNPVKDVLTLEYSNEISNVTIFNMLGQEVLSRAIDATSTQIDMSQLSAGTYLVNVSSGDIQKTIKVVKQ